MEEKEEEEGGRRVWVPLACCSKPKSLIPG